MQRLQAVKRALAHAASLGVTSVQHMNPDYADIAVYSELLERGELTARIYAAPLIPSVDDQVKIGVRHAFGGPYLRIGALKAYADGRWVLPLPISSIPSAINPITAACSPTKCIRFR